jgi:hypothetical protein
LRQRQIIGERKTDIIHLHALGQTVIGLPIGVKLADFLRGDRNSRQVVAALEENHLGQDLLVIAAVQRLDFLRGYQIAPGSGDHEQLLDAEIVPDVTFKVAEVQALWPEQLRFKFRHGHRIAAIDRAHPGAGRLGHRIITDVNAQFLHFLDKQQPLIHFALQVEIGSRPAPARPGAATGVKVIQPDFARRRFKQGRRDDQPIHDAVVAITPGCVDPRSRRTPPHECDDDRHNNDPPQNL